jgi:phosphoribosylformylglycinamidine synthase
LKVAVIVFPGSNCDYDTYNVLKKVLRVDTDLIWHNRTEIENYDAFILPGGFSYGDNLRGGIIAAFSPIMKYIKNVANEGKPVLGICNGFQILLEAGILPGALLTNLSLKFICRWTKLKIESNRTSFTCSSNEGAILNMPVAHHQGRYYIDNLGLTKLREKDQIILSYVDENGDKTKDANPNGSLVNIAGICNEEGNVVGLMPHPERSSESILSPFNSSDGLILFRSMVQNLK